MKDIAATLLFVFIISTLAAQDTWFTFGNKDTTLIGFRIYQVSWLTAQIGKIEIMHQ